MPITWDEPSHSSALPPRPKSPYAPGKILKTPPNNVKRVHFTPPSSTVPAGPTPPSALVADQTALSTPPMPDSGLPTPDPTPERVARKKGSFVSRLFRGQPPSTPTPQQPPVLPPTPQAEWHHHESYFPEYTPISPTPTVSGDGSYFPEYKPILHPSHPLNSYPSASRAITYALSTPEAVAARQAQKLGHAVGIYYPDLPRFAEYSSKNAKTGWESGKYGYGVEGWTGIGWEGEKLPDPQGKIFGVPMPEGTPLPGIGGGKKKKGKGGGGAGDAGGQQEEEADE